MRWAFYVSPRRRVTALKNDTRWQDDASESFKNSILTPRYSERMVSKDRILNKVAKVEIVL